MPTFIALNDFKIPIVDVLIFVFKAPCFFLRTKLNMWAVPTLQDYLKLITYLKSMFPLSDGSYSG